MALAQPTGLTVQALEPFATLDQEVKRENAGGPFATLSQWTGGANPGGVFATLEQRTGYLRANAGGTFATLDQRTGNLRINDGGPFATLDQTVVFLRENPGGVFATLAQEVKRENAGGVFARLRQTVASPQPSTALERHTRVYLDDADITARVGAAYSVTASEGDNRTAQVTYYPPSGPINITSYQGREVEIRAKIGGAWRAIFSGVVDVPTYDRETRSLRLRCSDLRNERLAREDHTKLINLTGGIYSEVTQQKEAEGEQWVRELMKTVSGSLDYTGAGALRYRPWALGATDHTLAAADIHHREISMDFATRSEVVNRIKAKIEYRWYKKHSLRATTGWSIPTTRACNKGVCLPMPGYALPKKESIYSREGGRLGQWTITRASATSPPPSGWYTIGLDTGGSLSDNKVAYITNEIFRSTYATGGSLNLTLWISQAHRETYDLTITAPQSADQFGEIDGGELRFALESEIDPAVFEAGGCVVGPDDDRRDDLNEAIQATQAIARKQILVGHRQNYASLRYKPKTGRPGSAELMPVEIGDVVSSTSDEVTVTGFVTELTHTATATGDRYTDIKLAVSRVDSAVSVTEDWSLPPEPARFALNEKAAGDPADVLCPGSDGPTQDGINEDGEMTFVAPSVSRDKTDELVGKVSKTYQLSIPVDTFDVEVP